MGKLRRSVLRPHNVVPRPGELLRSHWVLFFGVDAEFLDGFVEDFGRRVCRRGVARAGVASAMLRASTSKKVRRMCGLRCGRSRRCRATRAAAAATC